MSVARKPAISRAAGHPADAILDRPTVPQPAPPAQDQQGRLRRRAGKVQNG